MNWLQALLAFLFGWGSNQGGGGGGGNGNNNGGGNNNNPNPSPTHSFSSDGGDVVHIAILGGGIAGIAAARELEMAGMEDYLVLEAFDDHLGGQFWSEKAAWGPNTPTIEYGIRYVQGLRHNPLYDLAKNRVKMRMHKVNYNKVEVYDQNSQVLSNPEIPWMEWDKAFVCAEEAGDALNQAGTEPSPWTNGQVLLEEECDWVNEGFETPIKDVLEWFDMDFEYGDEPKDVAAYAFPEYTYVDFGPNEMFGTDTRGFESVIDYLKQDIDMAKVRMGGNVKSVEYLSGLTCPSKLTEDVKNDNENCVKINLESGGPIFAKFVISTIPFGAYKDKCNDPDGLFPNAPDGWGELCSKFFMGNYHSTYMKFTEKFWEDTEMILSARTEDSPYVMGIKPLDTGHPKHYWPDSNVLQINAGGDDAGGEESETETFDELCFKYQGNPSDTGLKDRILERLKAMYPDKTVELDDDKIFCTRFSVGSRFGGAWFQFGPDATPSDYEMLFAPQHQAAGDDPWPDGDGNLLFSGSGSCRRYYGFGHGGLISGWRDGNKVLEKINETYESTFEVTPENRCEEVPSNYGKAIPRSKRFRGQ